MTNEEIDQIHEAARTLRKIIERIDGNKAIIMWSSIGEDDKNITDGITLSDEITSTDLEHCTFHLIGRAYSMLELDDDE